MLILSQNAHRPTWRIPIRTSNSLLINNSARSTRALPDNDNDTDRDDTMGGLPNGTSHDSAQSSQTSLVLPELQTNDNQTDGDHVNGTVLDSEMNGHHIDLDANGPIEPYDNPGSDHVIRLSGIEHCMPRSYIRICLAYRLPSQDMLSQVVQRLNDFVRKCVDAKPYLSGYVVAVDNPGNRVGAVEIRFSDTDFLKYPDVGVRELSREEVDFTYDQLCEAGLPPSVIKPDIVSALGESADENRAPVFRVQANVIEGGIIVSVYLHHCISDGTGAGLLILGSVLRDRFTFNRHLDGGNHEIPSLSMRLNAFAEQMSHVRNELSWSDPNQINNRQLKGKMVPSSSHENNLLKPIGRGIVFAIPWAKLADLKERLQGHVEDDLKTCMSRNDVLMSFLWHSMTKARIPSLSADLHIMNSKLNIPVDIRKKLEHHLSESYFGAAVDFASAELSLYHLMDSSDACMAQTAVTIRQAITRMNEEYIRQAIALAIYSRPSIDVRDLQGSNMDRANAADMYITSWEKLKLYDATFEMGLGRPDWVRKPWSRDPGSCIVLPFDDRKDHLEVVIQMAEPDMERLLDDEAFMDYVSRWIE